MSERKEKGANTRDGFGGKFEGIGVTVFSLTEAASKVENIGFAFICERDGLASLCINRYVLEMRQRGHLV